MFVCVCVCVNVKTRVEKLDDIRQNKMQDNCRRNEITEGNVGINKGEISIRNAVTREEKCINPLIQQTEKKEVKWYGHVAIKHSQDRK